VTDAERNICGKVSRFGVEMMKKFLRPKFACSIR